VNNRTWDEVGKGQSESNEESKEIISILGVRQNYSTQAKTHPAHYGGSGQGTTKSKKGDSDSKPVSMCAARCHRTCPRTADLGMLAHGT